MTSNQIANKVAEETKRSNKEKERQGRENIKIGKVKAYSDVISNAVGNPLSKLMGIGSLGKNDPSWYNLDKQLVKDVATVSFNTPLGNRVNTEGDPSVLPGLMSITFMPSVGNSYSAASSSIANVAAKNIYAYVRHANSGSRNYEASDLMMYIMGVDQAISYWASLCRIYSAVMTNKSENRYYLDGVLYALGVSPDSIRQNIANLRSYINSFAVRLNSFYIPNDMPILTRHVWMNSTIFKDQPVKKSQDYVFVQRKFGIYNGVDGSIDFLKGDGVFDGSNNFFAGSNRTFEDLRIVGEELLFNLIGNEDIGIMSGDILKAYGEGHIYFIPTIQEDYHIESVYNLEVLSQIQSATLAGDFVTDSTLEASGASVFNIKQDDNSEIYQGLKYWDFDEAKPEEFAGYAVPVTLGQSLSSTSQGYLMGNSYLLNMYKDDVTPDDVMVATRLMAAYQPNKAFNSPDTEGARVRYDAIVSCGTEICLNAYVIHLNWSGTFANTPSVYFKYSKYNQVNDEGPIVAAAVMGRYIKFDWAPNVYIVNPKYDRSGITGCFTLDSANYANLNVKDLDNMNYVAVLSEFAVPRLGMKVRSR